MSDACVCTPATPQDVPQLVQLLNILFGIEQDFRADPEKQERGLLDYDDLIDKTLLATPEKAVIMTARDAHGNVIGMVSAQLVISTAEGAYSAWIEDMVIAEGWRTQGIGRRLLSSALDWARSRGATRAQLLVDLDNEPALGYYDHLGWQATRLGARRISLQS